MKIDFDKGSTIRGLDTSSLVAALVSEGYTPSMLCAGSIGGGISPTISKTSAQLVKITDVSLAADHLYKTFFSEDFLSLIFDSNNVAPGEVKEFILKALCASILESMVNSGLDLSLLYFNKEDVAVSPVEYLEHLQRLSALDFNFGQTLNTSEMSEKSLNSEEVFASWAILNSSPFVKLVTSTSSASFDNTGFHALSVAALRDSLSNFRSLIPKKYFMYLNDLTRILPTIERFINPGATVIDLDKLYRTVHTEDGTSHSQDGIRRIIKDAVTPSGTIKAGTKSLPYKKVVSCVNISKEHLGDVPIARPQKLEESQRLTEHCLYELIVAKNSFLSLSEVYSGLNAHNSSIISIDRLSSINVYSLTKEEHYEKRDDYTIEEILDITLKIPGAELKAIIDKESDIFEVLKAIKRFAEGKNIADLGADSAETDFYDFLDYREVVIGFLSVPTICSYMRNNPIFRSFGSTDRDIKHSLKSAMLSAYGTAYAKEIDHFIDFITKRFVQEYLAIAKQERANLFDEHSINQLSGRETNHRNALLYNIAFMGGREKFIKTIAGPQFGEEVLNQDVAQKLEIALNVFSSDTLFDLTEEKSPDDIVLSLPKSSTDPSITDMSKPIAVISDLQLQLESKLRVVIGSESITGVDKFNGLMSRDELNEVLADIRTPLSVSLVPRNNLGGGIFFEFDISVSTETTVSELFGSEAGGSLTFVSLTPDAVDENVEVVLPHSLGTLLKSPQFNVEDIVMGSRAGENIVAPARLLKKELVLRPGNALLFSIIENMKSLIEPRGLYMLYSSRDAEYENLKEVKTSRLPDLSITCLSMITDMLKSSNLSTDRERLIMSASLYNLALKFLLYGHTTGDCVNFGANNGLYPVTKECVDNWKVSSAIDYTSVLVPIDL